MALAEPQGGHTTHKFVVVLNKKIPPTSCPQRLRPATLVARADNQTRSNMSFVDYTDADGTAHPVSALSLVVLSAKTPISSAPRASKRSGPGCHLSTAPRR